jgi:hypothetical protein
MPSEATQAGPASNSEVSKMFDQAFRALGDSVKVAMKAQEDTVQFWSQAVSKANPVQAVAGEWIPTAQKNAEEYLRLLESSYRRNADLLKKVVQNQNGDEGIGMEKRASDWLQASIAVARDNAQDLASTNLRVAQAWTEVFKKGTQEGAQFVQQSAQQGAHFAQQQKAGAAK